MPSDLTRRGFLAGAAACAASFRLRAPANPSWRGGVVEVRHPAWRREGGAEPRLVKAMVERGLTRLTGERSAAAAWRRIVAPGERVGVKFSKTSRNASGANQALGDVLLEGLRGAGVRRRDVIVVEAWGARFPGTGEFDGSYGPEVDTDLARVRLTRFIRQQIDALINVPELKPHPRLGASGARSTVALATTIIDRPWRLHGPRLADHVSAIYGLPAIATRCRLHILNGLGGPAALFLSRDALALDRLAVARVRG
ncbi:MAG: hypothetical protein ACOC8D_00605 [bacterium]